MEYTHAKDYLIELANGAQTHGWLKDLIIRTINTNGHLSDEDLSLTTTQLKSNSASTLTVPNTQNTNNHADIRFISLTHNAGVCALANDQTIVFSKDITLLYGNNGSGKSSYFRILNEIIGGNRKTELRPNIYTSTNNSINIRLTYAEGDSVKELSWDGTTRAISPLNLSSVFDSNYTMAFLQKRSAGTAIVLPYGLHLFTALTTAMDNIKGRLQTEIDGVLKSLPQINTEGLSDDVIRILTQQTYRSTQKKYIQDRYIISSEQDEELNRQKEELKKLQETNYNDKIKIAKSELAQYEALKKHLTTTKDFLREYELEAHSLISLVVVSKKKSEDVKQKIAVLSEIGNTDSKEWKSFIESGAKFVEKANLSKDICPYCRQPLVNQALQIISSYETYLTDKSFSELNQALTSKEILRKKISNIITDYTISEQFKTLIDTETTTTLTETTPAETTAPEETTTSTEPTTSEIIETTTAETTTMDDTDISCGDINTDGVVDLRDAIYLNKYLAKLVALTDIQLKNADVYADGNISEADTTHLMRFVLNMITDLPVPPEA